MTVHPVLAICALCATAAAASAVNVTAAAPWAIFTNSSNTLTISTPLFNISLDAQHGAFLGLRDAAGTPLLLPSALGSLWTLRGSSSTVSSSTLGPFAAAWSVGGGVSTLALSWGAAPAPVRVDFVIPDGARWFDGVFTLASSALPFAGSAALTQLQFPAQAILPGSRINRVFYPLLPGVVLNASWFNASVSTYIPYPGSGTFAELLHVNVSSGGAPGGAPATLSVFDVSGGPDVAVPHFNGLFNAPASFKTPDEQNPWVFDRSINPVNVSAGCDPAGAGAQPCGLGVRGVVRSRFAVGGSVLDDVALYGASNGLLAPPPAAPPGLVPVTGAGSLPPLASRLPADVAIKLARAVLYKLDKNVINVNFSSYEDAILPALPLPGIAHFVGIEPGAFDHNYPAFMPPDPRFGTGCDLAAAFAAASRAGHLTMPYTNPTWWDPASPAFASLTTAQLLALAVINSSGQPHTEVYGPGTFGFVVEPSAPFAMTWWRRMLCLFGAAGGPWCDAPARARRESSCDEGAVRLNTTFVFEDQLGARNALVDFSPLQVGAGGGGGYTAALIAHAQTFSAARIGTEQGFDKIGRQVFGFFGSALSIALKPGGYPLVQPDWSPLPAASLLFGASLYLSMHNLQGNTFSNAGVDGPANLCWALSTGTALSIDASTAHYWTAAEAAWVRAATLVQSVLASQWVGLALESYESLAGADVAPSVGAGTSRSVFSAAAGAPRIFPDATSVSYAVTQNWANVDAVTINLPAALPFPARPAGAPPLTFSLPPRGCAAWGSAADVLGGLFDDTYNGARLAEGPVVPGSAPHVILEDRGARTAGGAPAIRLYHPIGSDTPLSVQAPAASCAAPLVFAVPLDGGASVTVPAAFDEASGLITFTAAAGQSVDHFEISCGG